MVLPYNRCNLDGRLPEGGLNSNNFSLTRLSAYGLIAGTALVTGSLIWAALFGKAMLTSGFLPHGVCYTWNTELISLHVVSDALIGIAYFSIPGTLIYFIRKRRDVPFNWMFSLFGLFIIACGFTHWMEIITLWMPQYWISGIVKAVTAAVSIPTAIALVWLVPRALSLPSVAQLQEAKAALEIEVAERKRIEQRLIDAGENLEQRVAQRTRELADANAELQQQREWLEVTLSSIGDAVIATDRDGNITLLNKVACNLTGWPLEQAIGKPIERVFNICDEHSRQPTVNPIRSAIERNAIVGLANHTVLLKRDGTEISIDDSAAPIHDRAGMTLGAVLIFRDVSEKKRAEVALSEADRRKDHFLAILSHELRGPLNPIRAAVGVLRERHIAESEYMKARDIIERQVASLARLLDDLLDVSRITQNKLSLRRRQIAVKQVLLNAVETCRPLMEARAHRMTLELPASDLFVDVDPTRLEQVLCNLLNNASKYTPNGGDLRFALSASNNEAVISVKDSGIGVAPEHLDSIFELFSQIEDSTLDRRAGGLGIGLSVAKNLIEMQGGRIKVLSKGKGQGSEFIVTLPLVETHAEPAAVVERHVAPASDQPLRVMVADDNVDSADSLTLLLQIQGYDVRAAHGGVEALELAEAFKPQVAILDIGMPGMNGYEVARQLRTREWAAGMILVAATGGGQDQDKRLASEAGFDVHMTKPVDLDALQNVLTRASGPSQSQS